MVSTTDINEIEVDPATGLAKGYKVTPARLAQLRVAAVKGGTSPMVGRPPSYADDELSLFEQRIEDYFAECRAKGEHATTYGLALALRIDRDTLMRYGEGERDNEQTDEEGLGRKGFSAAVKRAKLYLRAQTEATLMSGKATVGAIFWLKNNAGWKDQESQGVNSGITVVLNGFGGDIPKSLPKSDGVIDLQPVGNIHMSIPGTTDNVSGVLDGDGDE